LAQENLKEWKKNNRQRRITGGCRLSDPEAECNAATVAKKALAGTEREKERK
jgi:hypothetical protein